MPQVDGPANLLSGSDEENDKIDLTEDPVLENREDSQVVDSASMEQDADAISTEDPVSDNQEHSDVADSASMERDADATSTEDPVLENQEDTEVADSTRMERDVDATSTEDPVLENQEDSQVVDSGSTEQDADATSTEDPLLENKEDSQVADSGSTEQAADATSIEGTVLENQEDSHVADAASMEHDMNEAPAEEAQVKLEITGMDPTEASSEKASMPDAMELPENDESERVENNDIKLMTVDIYSSESEKPSVPEHSSPEDSVSQLSQEENQALEKYRVKLYVVISDVLYRVVDVPLVIVPTPMQAQVVY